MRGARGADCRSGEVRRCGGRRAPLRSLAMTSVTDDATVAVVGLGSNGPHGKRKGAKYVAGRTQDPQKCRGKVDGVIIYAI